MAVAGLRHDHLAVAAGADWIAAKVREGQRVLTLDIVQAAVETLNLKAGLPRAVLSIATLKKDPLGADADYALDRVDRFEGSADYLKRRPLLPATWKQLQDDIEKAPDRPGHSTAVSVTGSIRLAPAFLMGATFRMVTGTDLAVMQRGQLWSTSDPYPAPLVPVVEEHQLDAGEELAVAVAVAADPTDDVLEFLRRERPPVGKVLVLHPPGGTSDRSVPDTSAANALVVGIRDALRPAARTAPRIHLFIASPMGLALLLGHRWNRLRPTVVYEDVNTAAIYEAAFTISA